MHRGARTYPCALIRVRSGSFTHGCRHTDDQLTIKCEPFKGVPFALSDNCARLFNLQNHSGKF